LVYQNHSPEGRWSSYLPASGFFITLMKLKPDEPIELIKAESLILQALSQLQEEEKQCRDFTQKQNKKFQMDAIAKFIDLHRDTIQAYKLEIMNQRIMTVALQKYADFYLKEKHVITDDYIKALRDGIAARHKN
jgi:hypothetical protein